jgi:hypothetical protein
MRFRLAFVAVLAFAACGGSPDPPAAPPADLAARGHRGPDCSTQSTASFPGAFTDPHNLVIGPLVLVGGAFTDAETVRDFGGNKFPLLVKNGHTVTVRVAVRGAGLAYGLLRQGEIRLRDTHRAVTFVACDPGVRSSDASGVAVTFWSGFVLTRRPACVPLDVSADGGPPQRVGLQLGARC